ncbi:hypothetical protein AVEN_94134-1 [Araneus ventricosus]|uniref:Integrase catalytic domain-containing protein n=1 Tax=Araneus ventricosus TaxID=182803 RepID=A0A4Y2U138_ARAVE|nr:hypothetical protein AVEN_98934-1 [Araneus ventricosus]GBO05362.1 hypothetical protein AVEN_94134-1 [Araneus ventricosus]
MGALVGAKLWKHLSVVFKSLVKRVAVWTDSEICLHWIKSSATELKQFVSNRVVEIQDCVVPNRWFHCQGLENPADRLTRGVSAVSLKSDDLWWSGPRWLKSPRYDWPQQKFRVSDESKYTDLLILQEHNRGFHLGVIATLSRLRERFWIPKGRQSVKSVLKSCLVCHKYSAKPARQQTRQLPKYRVVACPPFTTVGIDFTGAITVKTTGGALQKVYIVLFTCAVTRAVHLEVDFIMSLCRFLVRRGCVKVFYSDNAKTFRSSCEILKRFKSIIRQPELNSFITSEGISWKFIPERSPWWGGFWERLMRSIKEPLRKTLGRALLTLEELSTILTEIESVINNRPITYDSDELDEPRALTPSHFLLPGHRNTGFVPEYFLDLFVFASDRVTLSRRKLFQTKLLKQLWVKWKEQYLLLLKSAHNLANPSSYNNLKIGDIVLVEGASKSMLLWEMGVIHEVIMGRDGFVRACVVKTSKGKLRRAVQLLYPLEI